MLFFPFLLKKKQKKTSDNSEALENILDFDIWFVLLDLDYLKHQTLIDFAVAIKQ